MFVDLVVAASDREAEERAPELGSRPPMSKTRGVTGRTDQDRVPAGRRNAHARVPTPIRLRHAAATTRRSESGGGGSAAVERCGMRPPALARTGSLGDGAEKTMPSRATRHDSADGSPARGRSSMCRDVHQHGIHCLEQPSRGQHSNTQVEKAIANLGTSAEQAPLRLHIGGEPGSPRGFFSQRQQVGVRRRGQGNHYLSQCWRNRGQVCQHVGVVHWDALMRAGCPSRRVSLHTGCGIHIGRGWRNWGQLQSWRTSARMGHTDGSIQRRHRGDADPARRGADTTLGRGVWGAGGAVAEVASRRAERAAAGSDGLGRESDAQDRLPILSRSARYAAG